MPRTLLFLGFALMLVPMAGATEERGRGPFALVSLASVGTVTWRCAPRATPSETRYGLGFRVPVASATTVVTVRAGRRPVRHVTVQPGESRQFPLLGRVQRLDIVQGGGAGTLRATVTVNFVWPAVAMYCFDYMPPPTTVTLSGRR